MGEYEASKYGIFNDAIGTAKTMNSELATANGTIKAAATALSSESVFMGPIADEAKNAFKDVDGRIEVLTGNFNKVSTVLDETATNYKAGDDTAKAKVLSFDDNGVMQETDAPAAFSGSNNEEKVYSYLASLGFNDAAICGILSNIEYESGFQTTIVGDRGSSYGLCQWHNTRWDDLNNFCNEHNLDSSTLEAQAQFLVYELKNSYPGVYDTLKNVPNTPDGAYEASYKWTVDFESPADEHNQGVNRGKSAMTTYWDRYAKKT